MGRIEKTVFISYRRTNLPWALFVYQNLTIHGFDVFFDYESIDSGNFENAILDNIRARAHFVIILTPSALERCKNPDDWLRREIETALDEKRNIVPLLIEGFDYGSPLVQEALTGKLSTLSLINGLPVPNAYALEAMNRLRERYLNKALSDVSLPILQAEGEKITESQKAAANEAEPVSEEQLSAQTWFERGYIFHEDGNLGEAIRCYSEAIRLDSKLAIAHNNLGTILHELKRYTEAETAYHKAIEVAPSFAGAYSNLGNTLNSLKRHDEAEIFCQKAIKLDPFLPEAYNNLGNTLNSLNRYKEAEAICLKALELDPSSAGAYINLGNALKSQNKLKNAVAFYRKALEIDPSNIIGYSNLGNTLCELKFYNEAETIFSKAIALEPTYAPVYNNMGNMLKDLKRYHEAESAYHKAIELNSSEIGFYQNLITLFRLNNNLEEATNLIKKTTAINSENFNSYLALASIDKQAGRKVSNEYTEKARTFMPEDDLYNRACLESVCDNFDLAFEYLEKASKLEGFNSSWAWDDPDLQWLRDDPRFVEIVGERPSPSTNEGHE